MYQAKLRSSNTQLKLTKNGLSTRKLGQRPSTIQRKVIGSQFQKIQTNRSLKHPRTQTNRILKHLTTIRTTMKTTTRMRITLKITMRILPRITTVLKQITVRMILQENSHRKQAILQALLPSMRWQEVRWLALEQ